MIVKKLPRFILPTLGLLLILWGVLILLVPILLPSTIIDSPNGDAEIRPEDFPTADELASLGVDYHIRIPVGPPSAELSCFVLNPKTFPSDSLLLGTILLLHGHRDKKLSQLDLAKWITARGYRVVLVDHRGHGLSTGEYVSFGVWERDDMVAVLDTLESRYLLQKPLGLIGFSYGGSVAIQLTARDERVAGVVSISTFSSLREVTEDYVKCFLPFIAPMLSSEQYDEAIAEAGKVAGFNPAEANTERAASTLRVPLLLIHGEDDWKIPIKHAERIKAAVGNSCLLVRVPERGHGDLLRGEVGVKLLEQSLRWLEEAFVKGNIDR